MLALLLLISLAVTIHADGYGAPPQAQRSISPAPAPYGAPYSSNQVIAMPQPQPQPQVQQVPQMPQVVPQYQQYPQFSQQPVPIGMQQVGFPMGYSMYSSAPQQMNQNPFQMYERQQLPNSLYVNYPHGMVIPSHHSQMQQQQTAQMQQTAVPPAAGTGFVVSSGYGSQPSISSSSSTGPYATQTTSAEIGSEEKGTTLATSGLTPAAVVDPWAALASVTPMKKIESRKKKNSEGL